MARTGLGRRLGGLLRAALRPARRPPAGSGVRSVEPAPAPGDVIAYEPHPDGAADPGEGGWAWVPVDEGDGRGKDRPLLVIARRGTHLLALMLSSKDHDRDAADEARYGRYWTDVGPGPWDRRGRNTGARGERLLVLDPSGVRREGAALDRERFDRVLAEARRTQGW